MLTVTDAALKAIKTLLAQLDISSSIRIVLKEGSCRGQTLRLSLSAESWKTTCALPLTG